MQLISAGTQLRLTNRTLGNLLGERVVNVPESSELIDAAIQGQRLSLWFAHDPDDLVDKARHLFLVPLQENVRTPRRKGPLRFVRLVDAGGVTMALFEELPAELADLDEVVRNAS